MRSRCQATRSPDIQTYFIGSVLSGGGGGPNGAGGTATQWADMVDNFQSYALQTRLRIPLIYGADAVHGHNNVYGATLFPHNIGLGAMHDPALITQVEQVTRDEVLGTGVRWTFAPCVCTPQDIRWGRTYEGYSEVPSDNATDGSAAITGFQGANGDSGANEYPGDGQALYRRWPYRLGHRLPLPQRGRCPGFRAAIGHDRPPAIPGGCLEQGRLGHDLVQ